MEGLSGVKILLLWAQIIAMVNCQGSPTPKAPPPPPPECFYNVTAIQFGFQVDMLNFTPANYNVIIKEEGRPGKPIVQSFNQKSHKIPHLKPCTEYELNVTFIDNAGKAKPCKHIENRTMTLTLDMTQTEVEEGSCMPGYVCYRSNWDISSSLSTKNYIPAMPCKSNNKEFCIKPGYNDICTNLTTSFTSGKCGAFFHLTKDITVDFLDPKEITQTGPTELPAKIEPNLPPNCSNLTIDYTCQAVTRMRKNFDCTRGTAETHETRRQERADEHEASRCTHCVSTSTTGFSYSRCRRGC
ncbi:uncharacterized protein LOC129094971 isoform X1 [Anoplopoma fimbria]|uniref:uncharacterized protein LOC129094971 isoform X1 n=1 Tax=Anoplopoma fimbria TaxID=229290 RepID=UPI0023EDDEE7|nr:uncharacterized protein LOC129094971 isoform X1 [Anoplopoma fimbria]